MTWQHSHQLQQLSTHSLEPILDFLSVKEVAQCNLVCSSWHQHISQSAIWKRLCIRMFNLPSAFEHVLELNDCKSTTTKLYQCRKSPLVLQFASIFKTFVGGGEHEVFEVATLQGYNDTPTAQHEIRAQNVVAQNATVPLDYCSAPSKSIFCHLDLTELKPNDLLRLSEDDLKVHEESKPLDQLWMNRLLVALNKLNIDGMHTNDVDFPATFIQQFLTIFEKATSRIEDQEDFLFLVFNTFKKLNIFLSVMVKKLDYVMNFNDKVTFQELTKKVFGVWNDVIRNNNQIFTRLELIAVNEFREDFGCQKSEALTSIFSLFYFMNNPKKWALPSKQFNGARYACEFLFKVYELTLGSIIFANLKLIGMAPDENKLQLMVALLNAMKQECEYMAPLYKSCPSKTAIHIISKKCVEYAFSLNTDLSAIFAGLYKRYNCTLETYEEYRKDPAFVLYTEVPSELESGFHSLELHNVDVARKFGSFMYDHSEEIANTVRSMHELTTQMCKDFQMNAIVSKRSRASTSSTEPSTSSSRQAANTTRGRIRPREDSEETTPSKRQKR